MEQKPYVNIFEAVGWVCLDCGHKNYTDLIPVEDPAQLELIRKRINASGDSVISGLPLSVVCVKCSKEWGTGIGPQEDPFDYLNDLLLTLNALDEAEGEDFDAAVADIIDNAGVYEAALYALLNSLDEVEPDDEEV